MFYRRRITRLKLIDAAKFVGCVVLLAPFAVLCLCLSLLAAICYALVWSGLAVLFIIFITVSGFFQFTKRFMKKNNLFIKTASKIVI